MCFCVLLCRFSAHIPPSVIHCVPDCGSSGSVRRDCQVAGRSEQWLWLWHCASLTFPDLWAQCLHSRPSSIPQPFLNPQCQTENRGRERNRWQSVEEGRGLKGFTCVQKLKCGKSRRIVAFVKYISKSKLNTEGLNMSNVTRLCLLYLT